MVLVQIGGLEIDFPFEPYECQRIYMEHVVRALQTGQHGLLESPTGTGKTLCLLCAVLAWRETFVASLQVKPSAQAAKEDVRQLWSLAGNNTQSEDRRSRTLLSDLAADLSSDQDGKKRSTRSVPRIIYTSRTHSQLSQVVRELRRTRYRPKMSVLGSRGQLCIHPEVSRAKGVAQNAMCTKLVGQRKCKYKNELDTRKDKMVKAVFESPRDIEDIARFGEVQGICPLYLTREANETADIVLMPYNYVVDSHTRSMLGIDTSNDVVIIDEAHNIDSVCMDAMSFDFTQHLRDTCRKEIKTCNDMLGSTAFSGDQDVSNYNLLETLLVSLETEINKVPMPGEYFWDMGDAARRLFSDAGLLEESLKVVLAQLESAKNVLQSSTPYGNATPGLTTLSIAIKACFESDVFKLREDFRVCIMPEVMNPAPSSLRKHFTGTNAKGPRKFSLWCMNPGSAMSAIVEQGVRSILLTSGTLTPLSGTERDLGIPFRVKLENQHAIGRDQVWMTCIPRGPMNTRLNFSYKNRGSDDYVVDLGTALLNFAQVVPEGILVFFPSYQAMGKAIGLWKQRLPGQTSSLFERLEARKPVVMESRDSNTFHTAMEEHERNVKNRGGSALFAVCRGKTSEGLDFTDSLARAVLMVGIPYPMLKDPKVNLKREYLEKRCRGEGSEWYTQAAYRAVNQALGRIIRHRNDYGAVILCDERYGATDVLGRFSKWLRPHMKSFDGFGSTQRSLAMFFREAVRSPFSLQRKRDLEEEEMSRVRSMRRKCEVESVLETILPSREEKHGSDNRRDLKGDSLWRDMDEQLPLIRSELGDAEFTKFALLIQRAREVDDKLKKDEDMALIEMRKCFQDLFELLKSSEKGVELMKTLAALMPMGLRSNYQRYVLGFLLSRGMTTGEGVEGLLKATRLSIGEEEYSKFRKILAAIKKDEIKGDKLRSHALYKQFRNIIMRNVRPDQQMPAASELLEAWKPYLPPRLRESASPDFVRN